MIKVFRARPKGVMTRQAIALARSHNPRDHGANYAAHSRHFLYRCGCTLTCENGCIDFSMDLCHHYKYKVS